MGVLKKTNVADQHPGIEGEDDIEYRGNKNVLKSRQIEERESSLQRNKYVPKLVICSSSSTTSIEKREVLSAKVYNWLAGCWIETKERKPMYYYYYTICRERETHHNFWRIKYRSNLDARTAATTTFLSYILIYIGSLSLSYFFFYSDMLSRPVI